MRNYGIITGSEQLRNVTGSWWANADFSRIERIVYAVEHELATVIGNDTMEWLAAGNGSGKAWLHAACAVGYMACMRYYRLNDISHQDGGRKVKIDKENEARPFEWQLARDDRAHSKNTTGHSTGYSTNCATATSSKPRHNTRHNSSSSSAMPSH